MSENPRSTDKNIIFITPEELSRLSPDAPVYVLSTSTSSTFDTNSIASHCLSTETVSACSGTLASTESAVPSSTFASHPTFSTVCSTTTFPSYSMQPYPFTGPVQAGFVHYPPPVLPTGSFSPYVFNTSYPTPPPLFSMLPASTSWTSMPPTFLYNSLNKTATSTSFMPSSSTFFPYTSTLLTPTAFIPPFNPHQPPPIPTPPSVVSLTKNKVNTTQIHKDVSQVILKTTEEPRQTEKIKSQIDENTSTKLLDPIRYTKLVVLSAPGYFTFEESTGCQVATQQLIDLENRFENEVIARRIRATASDPFREPPPERPILSDNEQRQHFQSRRIMRNSQYQKKSKFPIFKLNKNKDINSTMINTDNSNKNLEITRSDKTNKNSLELKYGKARNSDQINFHQWDDMETNLDEDSIPNSDLVKTKLSACSDICTMTNTTDTINTITDTNRNNHKHRNHKNRSTHSNSLNLLNSSLSSISNLSNESLNLLCPNYLELSNHHAINGRSIGQRSLKQQQEIAYKLSNPNRLHPDIWHNELNEFNDGPACSCKPKYRIGPLHNQYEGEKAIPYCVPESNNRDRLYHYRVLINPTTNFVLPKPTKINYNQNDYIFDGFSIFLHYKLDKPPPCQVLRFNFLYDMFPIEEDFPEYFTVRSLDLLTQYIFVELLELLDLSWKPFGISESCPIVHLMPRFLRILPHNEIVNESTSNSLSSSSSSNQSDDSNNIVAEMLPINVILDYWLKEALTPVINFMELSSLQKFSPTEWSNYISDLRGSLATYPGKKPAAIRIDQLDRHSVTGISDQTKLIYPLIVHMTYTPMKLSLIREPKYKCVLKNFMKLQYLMMNKPRISPTDRAQLVQLANELEEMEHSGVHRREITVEISSEGFYRTGIRPDLSQHALNLVSLVAHLRFHKALESLEKRLDYKFKDKSLLHQALTHPSYRRTNFGTNQDHFQNSLVSCGPRILEYGDKLQLYKAWRKKGLTKMIQVMSFLPKMHEERSNIYGNERLEFLGDAVIEVISSIHLFFMFPELSEGHLDAYRQAIVQNQHLAELAVRLGIHKFLLYTHSVDFCYDSTFIYARSDAFEALMAAITLDAGLDVVDRIFGAVLFGDDERVHRVWVRIPPHPLQAQCPEGDRSWATKVPMLKKLCTLEDTLGIKFKHLRVLARAMTIRKTGFNFYTLGDNQRLEFLGDSLLKYVSTDYLFRHFPRHHEGHLSLLKNSLVNKYTQASVCSELGLEHYVIRREENSVTHQNQLKILPNKSGKNKRKWNPSTEEYDSSYNSNDTSHNPSNSIQNQNVKYRADLLEAFIGALFVDKDLTWVERFCQICFWPRLVEFILKQEWNDAKSKLQQCCLTFRSLHEDPEIAHYKVLEHSGPTNQRVYRVGVYFRGQILATGQGRSVQQAQMDAAKKALEIHQDTFRQLDFQRSVISRRYRQPYINKILDQVQNWDEQLVDYFIADNNDNVNSNTSDDNIDISITTTTTTNDNDNEQFKIKSANLLRTNSKDSNETFNSIESDQCESISQDTISNQSLMNECKLGQSFSCKQIDLEHLETPMDYMDVTNTNEIREIEYSINTTNHTGDDDNDNNNNNIKVVDDDDGDDDDEEEGEIREFEDDDDDDEYDDDEDVNETINSSKNNPFKSSVNVKQTNLNHKWKPNSNYIRHKNSSTNHRLFSNTKNSHSSRLMSGTLADLFHSRKL